MVGGVEEEVVRTTPEAIDLQATFRRMLEGGDRACAMEVSSHALALHRADAIHFEVALFTNLTQDHLDFHADMEDYFDAKRLLFEMGPRQRGRQRRRSLRARASPRNSSASPSRPRAPTPTSPPATSTFDAARRRASRPRRRRESRSDPRSPATSTSPTRSAASPPRARSGSSRDAAAAALARAARRPGRFEPIDEGQPFAVLVDYAHTPDSLENVLRAARRLTGAG